MHKTLQRQLKKFFGDDQGIPHEKASWDAFLQEINATYDSYDKDHILIERSLEISSKELNDKNQKLQENSALLGQKVIEMEIEKARDEAILGSIGEGMIVTDAQGMISVANKAAELILGISSSELKNRSVFVAYQLYDRDNIIVHRDQRPIAITLQTGERAKGIFTLHNKNGNTVVLEINANPIVQTGRIIGAIAIIRDVTEQKAIDQVKTEFISLASHQLRTPLSAVKWFAEMLLHGDAGKLTLEQEDFTRSIYDSIERMIQLVNSLLNVSRIESGRILVVPRPTDLKQIVEELVQEYDPVIKKKELRLIISVHATLPKINVDPRLIRQVYMNLLTNAIKYTEKGADIMVVISRKGEDVISQVSDSGYGIPQYQQGRVFQKFFRADNAAKKETDGTGLGLYLAKTIIESSRGKIWFESEEGKGTTFWFTLPLAGMIPKKGEVTLD